MTSAGAEGFNINEQMPTYTVAETETKLTSGEKISVAFGKIAKAVSSLINHLTNKSNPHGVTASQVGAVSATDKPKGTYIGNGDATSRTIATGGTGGVIFIHSSSGCVFVTPSNGLKIASGNTTVFWYADCHFSGGKLTIGSTDATLNESGVTYMYQVL